MSRKNAYILFVNNLFEKQIYYTKKYLLKCHLEI